MCRAIARPCQWVSYNVLDRDPEGNLENTQVFTVPKAIIS